MSRFQQLLLLATMFLSFLLVSSFLPPADLSHPTLANNTCIQGLPQCANPNIRLLLISIFSSMCIWNFLHIAKRIDIQSLMYIQRSTNIPPPPIQAALSRGRLSSRHYL